MNHFIANLAKGLVDRVIKGKVDKDYNRKALELENGWLTKENSFRKRPGLKPLVGDKLANVLDVVEHEDRTHVLQDKPESDWVKINITNKVDTALGGGSPNPIRVYEQDYQFTIPVDLATQTFRYKAVITVVNGTTEPTESRALLSYDKKGNRISRESHLFVKQDFSTTNTFVSVELRAENDDGSQTSTAFDLPERGFEATPLRQMSPIIETKDSTVTNSFFNNLKDYRLLFKPNMNSFNLINAIANNIRIGSVLGSLNELTLPAPGFGVTVTANNLDEIFRDIFLTQYGSDIGRLFDNTTAELVADLRDYIPKTQLFIVNDIELDTPTINTVIDTQPVRGISSRNFNIPKTTGRFINSISLNSIAINNVGNILNLSGVGAVHFPIFSDLQLPNKLYRKENETGLSINGLRFTLDRNLICDNTRSQGVDLLHLDEKNINTFPEKKLNRDLSKLPITAAHIELKGATDVNTDGTITPNISSLIDLQSTRPAFAKLYDYLKLSLTTKFNASNQGDVVDVIPDIKIVKPGSDVNAVGNYLFSIDNNTHVFAADSSAYYTRDILSKSEDIFSNNPYGQAVGSYGVTLYVQRYNARDNQNTPIFFPIPVNNPAGVNTALATRIEHFRGAITTEVVFLYLEPAHPDTNRLMEEIELASFYASDGQRGMVNTRISKLRASEASINPNKIGYLQDRTESNDLLNAVFPSIRKVGVDATNKARIASPQLGRIDTNDLYYKFRATNTIFTAKNRLQELFDLSNSLVDENGNSIKNTDDNITWAQAASVTGGGVSPDTFTPADFPKLRVTAAAAGDIATYIAGLRLEVSKAQQAERDLFAQRTVIVFRNQSHRVYINQSGRVTISGTEYRRETVREVLKNAELKLRQAEAGDILQDINFYSTDFKVYAPSEERDFFGEDRNVAMAGSRVNFSSERDRDNFSLGFVDFIRGNAYAYATVPYLRASGLLDYVLRDLGLVVGDLDGSVLNIAQPQIFDIPNARISHYADTDRGGVVVSTKGIYFASFTNQGIVLRRQIEEGANTEAIVVASMILAGQDTTLKVNRFYQEAGGYTSDIVNDELTFPSKIKDLVSLVETHKLALVSLEDNQNHIFALSLGEGRRIKGFSRFTFPSNVVSLSQLDNNRVAVNTQTESYALDFADIKHMTDQVDIETKKDYEYALRPLPLIQLGDENFSVTKNTSIRSMIVGAQGDIEFKYDIIDSLSGAKKTSSFKYAPKENVVDASGQGGLFWVNNVPANGSTLPEIRIYKLDDRFIEINTINIDLGDL